MPVSVNSLVIIYRVKIRIPTYNTKSFIKRLWTNNPYMLAYVCTISPCIGDKKRETKQNKTKQKARNYLHILIPI